jgi:lysophospholipase L1-like esterase
MIPLIRLRALAIVAAAVALGSCGSKPGPGPTPVIDPPSVSCPADITVTGITGSSQPVAFAIPAATAGTAPVTVTCAPNAGSAFPLGTTAVRCTASDAAARQGTCSFSVTVRGLTLAVTKYLAYGDSVTEGQNGLPERNLEFVDTPNAYPTKLQALLEESFPGQGISVVNRGRGGERAEDARLRLPEELAQQRPGALAIIDGYNNLLNQCRTRDVSTVTPSCAAEIELAAGSLREMVRVARGSGVAHVFVGTLTPSGPATGPSDRRLLPAAVTQLNTKIRMQIPGEGAIVVDIYPLFLGREAEYSGPDGLHILPSGNQVIADAFFTAIKAAIPQSGSVAGLR